MQLHQQIAQQRHLAGLSQHGLALAVDVTVRTVARWEAGEVTPDLHTLRRIAAALGVSTATLIEE